MINDPPSLMAVVSSSNSNSPALCRAQYHPSEAWGDVTAQQLGSMMPIQVGARCLQAMTRVTQPQTVGQVLADHWWIVKMIQNVHFCCMAFWCEVACAYARWLVLGEHSPGVIVEVVLVGRMFCLTKTVDKFWWQTSGHLEEHFRKGKSWHTRVPSEKIKSINESVHKLWNCHHPFNLLYSCICLL